MRLDLVWHCIQLSCCHATRRIVHQSFNRCHLSFQTQILTLPLQCSSYLAITQKPQYYQTRQTQLSTRPLAIFKKLTLNLRKRQLQYAGHVGACCKLTLVVGWYFPKKPPVCTRSSPGHSIKFVNRTYPLCGRSSIAVSVPFPYFQLFRKSNAQTYTYGGSVCHWTSKVRDHCFIHALS